MINIAENCIEFAGRKFDIIEWDVWFQTPFGLEQNRDSAIKRVVGADMSPQLTIRPVAVAIADGHYEIFA